MTDTTQEKKTFIDSENALKVVLNSSINGRNAKQQKANINDALNDFLFYGGVTFNKLLSFMSCENRKQQISNLNKLKNILSCNDKIKISEVLQEDKPKKEEYPQQITIKEYGLNKWGEVVLKNIRSEYVLKSRFRYPKRYLKVINLK